MRLFKFIDIEYTIQLNDIVFGYRPIFEDEDLTKLIWASFYIFDKCLPLVVPSKSNLVGSDKLILNFFEFVDKDGDHYMSIIKRFVVSFQNFVYNFISIF